MQASRFRALGLSDMPRNLLNFSASEVLAGKPCVAGLAKAGRGHVDGVAARDVRPRVAVHEHAGLLRTQQLVSQKHELRKIGASLVRLPIGEEVPRQLYAGKTVTVPVDENSARYDRSRDGGPCLKTVEISAAVADRRLCAYEGGRFEP